MAVQFISRPHTPALAFVCPREEWCVLSARATATVIRSCLSHERSRRCRRRCAAPELGCSLRSIRNKSDANKGTLGIDSFLVVIVLEISLTHVSIHTRKIPAEGMNLYAQSPRALTGVSVRGLKNGRSRPRGRSAKKWPKPHQNRQNDINTAIDCGVTEPC